MNYPLISEYIEAIKAAEDNFNELSNLRPVLNDDGEPVMTSGNFAVVFKMQDEQTGKLYAVKCFLKEQEGRAEAYRLISEELEFVSSPYLTPIKYLDNELFVDTDSSDETEFPILLMDWVEGETLEKIVKECIFSKNFDEYNIAALKRLALDFLDFAYWMSNQIFAHGDIKPDNIIITKDNQIVIVDYDGMYVPKMKGQRSRENGSPNYRHPNRNVDYYDASIDNFPLSVIAFSLAAIAINKKVYNNEVEDAFVLSDDNFRDIFNPKLLSKLSLVLHDKICSSLYSSILMQLSNMHSQIDFNKIFCTKTYIEVKPPIYLPYKIGENAYNIYSTEDGTCVSNHIFSDIRIINDTPDNTLMILSYGGEIDYTSFDDIGEVMRVTDFVLLEERRKRPKANLYALLSNNININNLKWFKLIKPISQSLFLVKNSDDLFGIISEDNVVLPCIYESIKPITQANFLYLLCKTTDKDNCLFLFTEDNGFIKAINGVFNDKCWHYKNGASAPENLIIYYDAEWKGYDLERARIIKLPSNLKRIKSYSEQILCVETWDSEDGYRLFNVDTECFLNNDIYVTVGFYTNELKPFNDGRVVCETKLHKNVIVFKDGSSFIIPFEKYRLRLGYNCKYIYYNDIVLEGSSRIGRGDDLEFTIFDYRSKELYSFTYHWDSYGMRAISIIDDTYISISSHNMKYNLTSHIEDLDLKGNHIDTNTHDNEDISKKNDTKTNELNCFDEEMMFKHYISSKFINKKYIHNVEEYERDFGIECEIKNGYAIIRGITDVDPEFGVSYDFIGYADVDRCYWKY